jgi:hypothetical protein
MKKISTWSKPAKDSDGPRLHLFNYATPKCKTAKEQEFQKVVLLHATPHETAIVVSISDANCIFFLSDANCIFNRKGTRISKGFFIV